MLKNCSKFSRGLPRCLRLEHLPCEESLWNIGLFSLKQRWLQAHLTAAPIAYGDITEDMELSSLQCCRTQYERQWANSNEGQKKQLLPRKGQSGGGTCCTGRLYTLHPWRFSRPEWNGWSPKQPGQTSTADIAISRRLDQRPPEVSPSLNSLILWQEAGTTVNLQRYFLS